MSAAVGPLAAAAGQAPSGDMGARLAAMRPACRALLRLLPEQPRQWQTAREAKQSAAAECVSLEAEAARAPPGTQRARLTVDCVAAQFRARLAGLVELYLQAAPPAQVAEVPSPPSNRTPALVARATA